MEDLKSRVLSIRNVLDSQNKALSYLYDIRARKITDKEIYDKQERELQRVLLLFKNLSEQENEKSRMIFISLINHGLNSIFGNGIKFDLERKDYQTGTFYFPVLLKDGKKEDLLASGGGILDIVSFLCRIVVLVSFFKEDSRVLRLDEPFKNLSVEYRQKAVDLIKQLSERFQIQFIFSTHIDEYTDIEGARVFKTVKKDGTTTYQLLDKQ